MHFSKAGENMKFDRITAKDNAVIKKTVKLITMPKRRREESLFVIEGLRLCSEIANSDITAEYVIVSDGCLEQKQNDVLKIAEQSRRCIVVPDSLFSHISDTRSPQGVLCVCKIPDRALNKNFGSGMYIALENMQDPSNLGAVARTAEALGISGIIVSGQGCDPYSPKVQRAGMGALLRTGVTVAPDFISEMKNLSADGWRLYGAVVSGSAGDVRKVRFAPKSVILIGNEARGLTDEAVGICSELITIPMSGRTESLNASVAAAILMWEALKQNYEER